MHLIFLDVDGVLINRSCFSGKGSENGRVAAPDCVARLNTIIAKTSASIVVSSVWRRDPNIKEILNRWGVEGKVVGTTPVLDNQPRGHEIQTWLNCHSDRYKVDRFAILDDDSDMAHLSAYLVQTKFEDGLTDQNVEDAIALLTPVINLAV